jgi:hypothetical protein
MASRIGLVILLAATLQLTVLARWPAPQSAQGQAGQPPRYVVGGAASDVVVVDGLAYVAVAGRLVPVDVSDPGAPVAAGQPLPFGGGSLVAGDGVAYYLARTGIGASGVLGVIDLADPLRPRRGPEVHTRGAPVRVAVDGDRAWVLGWWLPVADVHARTASYSPIHIDVFDLSDPRQPVGIGSLPTGAGTASGRDLAAAGGFAYVAADGPRIDTYRLAPDGEVEAVETPPLALDRPARLVATNGVVLAVADDGGVTLYDLADPLRPVQRARLPMLMWPRSVALTDDRLAIGVGSELSLFDIAAPDAPRPMGSLWLQSAASALDLAGDVVYVAAGDSGFQVVDFASQPGNPQRAALPGLGYAEHVVVDGSLLVAALSGPSRVVLIDRTAPPAFPVHAALERGGALKGLAVAGGHVYAFEQEDGSATALGVIDATDPRTPARVGRLETRVGSPMSVAVGDGGCLVTTWAGQGLVTFDVRNAARPVEAGSARQGGWTLSDLALQGDHAFALDRGFGLRVFDVSDCAQPREVARLADPRLGRSLALEPVGRRLYAAAGPVRAASSRSLAPAPRQQPTQPPPIEHETVLVIDVADPREPRASETWRVPGEVERIVADGGWVHVAYRQVSGQGWATSLLSRYLTGDERTTLSGLSTYRLAAAPDAVYWAGGDAGVWAKSLTDVLPGATPPTPTPAAAMATPSASYLPIAIVEGAR